MAFTVRNLPKKSRKNDGSDFVVTMGIIGGSRGGVGVQERGMPRRRTHVRPSCTWRRWGALYHFFTQPDYGGSHLLGIPSASFIFC